MDNQKLYVLRNHCGYLIGHIGQGYASGWHYAKLPNNPRVKCFSSERDALSYLEKHNLDFRYGIFVECVDIPKCFLG